MAAPGLPLGKTLDTLWAGAAVRFADRVALRADGASLTYRELDMKARGLVARLSSAGVGPGEICGLYLERSINAVVSILAVTLAGAAWLPLDPGYPAARLRAMAGDARIRHLISDRDTAVLGLDPPPRVHEVEPADAADLPA